VYQVQRIEDNFCWEKYLRLGRKK